VPAFYDWDQEAKVSVNRMLRPELTHSVIEIVAPQEYMVRPPQPNIFLFVIDVSHAAVMNGILHIDKLLYRFIGWDMQCCACVIG